MAGNFTSLHNITSLVDVVQVIHEQSGGVLGNGFVLVSFVVAYVVSKRFDSDKAFAVASFITAIMTILLKQLSLVNDYVLILVLALASISAVVTILSNN